jgi:acyl dehydratase
VVPSLEPRKREPRAEAPEPEPEPDAGTGYEPGARIPEFRITPDRYAAQRYAGASGDFTPFHLDAELARAIGLPGIILHGLYTYGQLVHGLLEPFGCDPRVLRSLSARFRRPAVPERELLVTGLVTAADGPRIEVSCAVSQGGRDVVSAGEAVLELPEK